MTVSKYNYDVIHTSILVFVTEHHMVRDLLRPIKNLLHGEKYAAAKVFS